MSLLAYEFPRRCSLPSLSSFSNGTAASGFSEDRKLPPLPGLSPLPRGPSNPFAPHAFTSPPSPENSFSVKSSLSAQLATPPSPPCSADSSFNDSFPHQPALWPGKLSRSEVLSLIAPKNLRRKAPLQQLCGQKRKGSMSEPDDQREKHRIAEGNRRKNLSQLHRELDSRLHDSFLMQAGWNPSRNMPQSKEHIVQATINLVDFMRVVISHLLHREGESTRELPESLQPQVRCMQLQQQVSGLQQENLATEQQLEAARMEKQGLEERNRALEHQLKSYDHVFRTPKSEAASPQPLSVFPENKPRQSSLPGLRVLCDDIDAPSPKSARRDSWVGPPQHLGQPLLGAPSPMSGPPTSLSFLPPSFLPPGPSGES